MRDDGWGCEPLLPKVNPKPVRNPAKEYARPDITKISVYLEVYETSFAPSQPDSFGACRVKSRIPSGSLVIPGGGSVVVSCGFGMRLPPGYRVQASSLIGGLLMDVSELEEFRLNVVNLGDETILNDGQQIGSIWVEPVCFFDWIHRG